MTLADLPLGPLERAFVASLQRLEPEASEPVLLAAALCCEALSAGDVCLPLERLAGRRPWPDVDLSMPALPVWRAQLEASTLVGTPDDYAPLTLVGDRLYLARYQAYEQQLAEQLLARTGDAPRWTKHGSPRAWRACSPSISSAPTGSAWPPRRQFGGAWR